MRQRKLGSHTPPCHRRMVITTLFSVLLAALQRRPVLYHTRWLLAVHWHCSSGHRGQLAPTTHPQCRLVSNPCPAGREVVSYSILRGAMAPWLAQRRLSISACAPSVRQLNKSFLLCVWRIPRLLAATGATGGGVVCSLLFSSFFLFVPTPVSSAIKADSVLRLHWPRGLYRKVILATGLDAGEAVLHRGRAQWGRRTCMYCTLHAGGGAYHDHRGSTPGKTAKLRLHQNQRATNHQELRIMTYRGPLVQNRKTHNRGGK